MSMTWGYLHRQRMSYIESVRMAGSIRDRERGRDSK